MDTVMASHPNRDQLSIQNQKNRRLTTVAPGCGGCCRRRGALGCNLMGLFAEPRRPARASPDRAELPPPPPAHPGCHRTRRCPVSSGPRPPSPLPPPHRAQTRRTAPAWHTRRGQSRRHGPSPARPTPRRSVDSPVYRLVNQLRSATCRRRPARTCELFFASRCRHRLPRVGRGAGANNRTHASQISGDTTTAEARI